MATPVYLFWAKQMNLPNTTILLKEWLRLSEHESEAIAEKEWGMLNDLLDQKSRIKALLETTVTTTFQKLTSYWLMN